MNFLIIIRILALVLIALLTFFSKSLFKKRKKEVPKEEFEQFEKNEDGLYPWEVNTDDDPKHLPEDARRFVEKDKIRRGKW